VKNGLFDSCARSPPSVEGIGVASSRTASLVNGVGDGGPLLAIDLVSGMIHHRTLPAALIHRQLSIRLVNARILSRSTATPRTSKAKPI